MTIEQTASLIYTTANACGMPPNMCQLIKAQSMHETDEYSSNAFKHDNNCFGYKYVPGAKWQIGAGITSTEKDPYAKYLSIENSVHEICDWIRRRQTGKKFPADLTTITTPFEYATLLKACLYYGDTVDHYTAGITHFLNS